VKTEVEVLCIVTSCSVTVGYKSFGGPCCLHLQGQVIQKMEAATLQGFSTQKTST